MSVLHVSRLPLDKKRLDAGRLVGLRGHNAHAEGDRARLILEHLESMLEYVCGAGVHVVLELGLLELLASAEIVRGAVGRRRVLALLAVARAVAGGGRRACQLFQQLRIVRQRSLFHTARRRR